MNVLTKNQMKRFWAAAKIYILPLSVSILMVIAGDLIRPGFAKPTNLANILTMSSVLAIVTISQSLVFISGGGGMDLSVGAVMSMACLLAPTYSKGDNLLFIPVCIILILIGGGFGLVNGLAIQFLQIPPLIMTMIMGLVVNGITYAVVRGQPSVTVPPVLLAMGDQVLGPIRVLFLVAAAFIIAFEIIMRKTRYGRSLFLIGSNRKAAELAGLPIKRNITIAYVLSGMMAMVAGMLLVGYVSTANGQMAEKYSMLSVAALAIGGTKLAGGEGSISAAALGAIVMLVLSGILVAAGLNAGVQKLAEGAILMFVLFLLFVNSPKLRQ